MRIILNLLLVGFVIGDGLVALMVAVYLFRNRKYSRTFLYLANLFACIALSFPALFIAIDKLPRPTPGGFRVWLLVGLGVIALGIWPAAIHLLLFTRETNGTQNGISNRGEQ